MLGGSWEVLNILLLSHACSLLKPRGCVASYKGNDNAGITIHGYMAFLFLNRCIGSQENDSYTKRKHAVTISKQPCTCSYVVLTTCKCVKNNVAV